MAYVIVLILILGLVWLIGMPIVRAHEAAHGTPDRDDRAVTSRAERRLDLEAARDAKYREIRDATLDHRTGKLSEADYAALDAGLRAEAVALLRELDELNKLDAAAEAASSAEIGALTEPDAYAAAHGQHSAGARKRSKRLPSRQQ